MLMRAISIFCFCCAVFHARSQSHESTIKDLFDQELENGRSYEMLEFLSKNIGHRLSGSRGAGRAVEWAAETMRAYADTVWLQPVRVPHWERGAQEMATVTSEERGTVPVEVTALGGSVGTGPEGISGDVVEIFDFTELEAVGPEVIAGKIVFFNKPLDESLIHTFAAYGGAVGMRASGASEAARYGAIGVVVRSMGHPGESYPHTGAMHYAPDVPKIPAVAVSTKDADVMSALLKHGNRLTFFMQTHCETLDEAMSFNVIGEMKGREHPDSIIVVSGHLDSWDVGQGAHDDGAGCVQAMEVMRLFYSIGYEPRYTLRVVLFMNEENGLQGGREYAGQAESKNEKHVCAIESDRGGFTPRGFTMTATETTKAAIRSWKPLLEPYGLTDFTQQGGGADISFLASSGVPLLGFLPDSQRYFSYHHSREDTFDKVNRRELELGAASIAAMVYLIDRHGLAR